MTTAISQEELEAKRERLRRWVRAGRSRSASRGINHVAIFAKDLEATAEFYTRVMGMPVVEVLPNRDVPESTHMNVDVGGGMRLSFFDFPHIRRLQRRAPEGVGNVMHVALAVSPSRKAAIKKRLDRYKVRYQEVAGSIYLKDPNGLGIELLPED